MNNRCPHSRRGIYRVPWASGGGEHLVELCEECGANVRGAGVWVKRSEVRDPASVPLAPGKTVSTKQPSLFDAIDG